MDTCARSPFNPERVLLVKNQLSAGQHAHRMCHREHNCLHQLLYLLVEATNVTVVLCGLLIHLHGLDSGVILCWQRVQDEVRVLQQTSSNSRRPSPACFSPSLSRTPCMGERRQLPSGACPCSHNQSKHEVHGLFCDPHQDMEM